MWHGLCDIFSFGAKSFILWKISRIVKHMFGKVLLATDLSPAYDKLTKCIVELKELGTEEIILVWVVNVETAGLSAADVREHHIKKLEAEGKELERMGVSVTYEAPIGIPSQEIGRMAQEKDVDLIVIGSRGERKMRNMFLGSTTSNVIRLSSVPTLVERIDLDEHLDNESYMLVCKRKFKSILIATDFSENAREAERAALELSKKADKVVVVSVAETVGSEEKRSPAVAKDKERLEKLKHQFGNHCDEVVIRFEEGIASENINRIAADEDTTLIIIGKKGKGGFKELLLGSTAEAVARRSQKPILLVPSKDN